MNPTLRTARTTGALYLALAVTGMLGFLVVRPMLYVDDPAQTVANLAERTALAHASVGLEMAIVLSQALVAVWFYRLFRPLSPVAAFATATFGLLNAAAIMCSGMAMATAVAVAADPGLAPGADAVGTVALLGTVSDSAWGMGNLFFGLWLVPMGWVALITGRFPRPLGWVLMAGGVGYVASGLAAYALADAPGWLTSALVVPANVGEFWLLGYLLVVGIRRADHPRALATVGATQV